MNKNKLPARLDSLIEAKENVDHMSIADWNDDGQQIKRYYYCVLFNKGKIPELHIFNSKKSRDLYVITSPSHVTSGYKFYQSITYKEMKLIPEANVVYHDND